MKSTLIKLSAALLAASMLFTGCGGGTDALAGQTDKPTETTQTPAEPVKVENGKVTTPNGTVINLESKPIVDEPITINIACIRGSSMSVPYSEMPVIKDFEEQTGVHIEWNEIDGSAKDEKINLLFSSNDLPDAFYGGGILSDAQVSMFAQTGALVPLNDLIDNYAPGIKAFMDSREDYKKAVSDKDGKIYGLAALIEEDRNYASQHLFINKTWLDNLGLPVPTTTEELYTTLKAFKEKDPNGNGKQDEIPFSLSEKFFGLHTLFGSFGLPDRGSSWDTLSHLSIKDGKVIYNAIQPEYKEAIKYFNRLYTEGLLDPEIFTQDKAQLKAKGNDPAVILGMTLAFWPDDVLAKDIQDQYIHLMPVKGPNGDQLLARDSTPPAGLSRNSFMITSANENPEVTMRLLDVLCEAENSLAALHGERGVAWDYTDEAAGTYQTWNDKAPDGMTYDQFRHTLAPASAAFYLIPKELADKRVLDPMNADQEARYQEYIPYLQPEDEVMPELYLSSDDQNQISAFGTDIKNYVDQMRAKWITEGGIDEEWDTYVEKVNSLGVSDMTDIYQQYI